MKTNLMIVLLLVLNSCTQTSEKKEAVEKAENSPAKIKGWNTLDEANYSIQYPASWEENKTGQMGTSFIVFSSVDSDTDDFRENVNLVVQDLSGRDYDLDSYTELSVSQIKKMLGVSSFKENKRLKNANGDYQKLIYAGDQGNYHLVFEQYYWIINNQAFVLTFTSEQDQYNAYKKVGEQILNSFIVKS